MEVLTLLLKSRYDLCIPMNSEYSLIITNRESIVRLMNRLAANLPMSSCCLLKRSALTPIIKSLNLTQSIYRQGASVTIAIAYLSLPG